MSDPSLFLDGYAALVAQRAGDEGRDASRLLTTLRVLATLEAQAVPDQTIWESADINKPIESVRGSPRSDPRHRSIGRIRQQSTQAADLVSQAVPRGHGAVTGVGG